jgi:hypothetical protein
MHPKRQSGRIFSCRAVGIRPNAVSFDLAH